MRPADTQRVDIREKTFADEAIKQLKFLIDQYDFTGPYVSRGTSPGTAVRVGYHQGDATIETSLVFWYMGEDYVVTARVTDDHGGRTRRTEIARHTAHTGYQMRQALKLQAQAVRAALHSPRRMHQRPHRGDDPGTCDLHIVGAQASRPIFGLFHQRPPESLQRRYPGDRASYLGDEEGAGRIF